MRSRRRSVAALVAVVTSLTLAFSPEVDARELAYRPAAGCPDEADVARSIAQRAPEGRDAEITIARNASSYHGELVLGHGDAQLTRAVDGRSCRAVIEALVLVVALDGDSPSNSADDAQPELPAATTRNQTVTAPPEAQQAAALPPDPGARTEWSLGVAACTTTLVNGRMIAGGSLFVDVAADEGLLGIRLLRPSLRLAVTRTLPEVVASETRADLATHFRLTSASVEACPIGSSALGGRLTAAICARWDVGALTAAVGGGPSESRLFDALGGEMRVRLLTARPGAWRPLFELGGGAMAPLARDRFHVLEDTALVVPPWLLTASLGVGVVLP